MQSHSIFLMWKSIQKVYMRNVMKTSCIFARNNDRNYSGIHIRVIKPQAIQICMWPVMFAWSTPCCEWLWIWNFYMLNRFKRKKMKVYLCFIPLVHVAKYHLHEEEEQTKLAWSITFLMMTSSNGNIFRVTGHLCGEFTKASDAEIWCFLWSASE